MAIKDPTGFVLEPQGTFSLRAAARFWAGFTPAAHAGLAADGHIHMAFSTDGSWQSVGVCLRDGAGVISAEVYGDADVERLSQQVARVLSLDVDGRGFAALGERDPVVADLQRRYPGLRPVCFYSPYEAAVWAILSQRVQMGQAARVKERMREALGDVVSVHGQAERAFPGPRALLELGDFPGLFGDKARRLNSVARAALDGDLDAAYLRSLPDARALAHLRRVPGIGPFGAELILLRGAGHPDYLTLVERRFRSAVERAYGLDHTPTDNDLQRISELWRPYRTWVTFLLRQASPTV
jgi:DNA-3-methyladenine glycosylase II